MDKKKLLFISSHLPSFLVPQAGQKSARKNLEEYSKDFDVYLISFVNEIEKEYVKKDDFSFCKEYYFFNVSNVTRIHGIIKNIFLPLNTMYRANSQVIKTIKKLQERVNFDLINLEYTASAYYIDSIYQNCMKVISQHDITYQSVERTYLNSTGIAKLFLKLEYMRQKRWELKTLPKFDNILVHNIKDKILLSGDGIPGDKIKVIKPYINPEMKCIERNNLQRHSILFWGAMNRIENIDAVLWFTKEIFSTVSMKFPDTKLYIVGTNPSKKIRNLISDKIQVTGFVDDPKEYFEKCEVAVAPLRRGAGIKIKVLEYLEAGMPVIATSVGAEGIIHERLNIADDANIFSDKIIEIFECGIR